MSNKKTAKGKSNSKDKTTKNENEFSLLKTLIIVPITKTQSDAGRVNITGQLITGVLTALTLIPSALEIILNIIRVIGNIFLTYNNKTIISGIDNSVVPENFRFCLILLFIEFIICSGVILISDQLKNNRDQKDN